MGLPDRCQHAAHIISELILTAQVGSGGSWEERAYLGMELVCVQLCGWMLPWQGQQR